VRVERPGKIAAIGLNYLDHIREAELEPPPKPLVFAKFPSSVIGDGEPIRIPRAQTERVDWEVELAVVIGERMRDVDPDAALDYVAGYTVANDVSARDLQFSEGQWTRAKSFDSFCPLGPVVVAAAEIADPQALSLLTRVNGELVQDSSTAEMVFRLASCSRSARAALPSSPATSSSRAPRGVAASSWTRRGRCAVATSSKSRSTASGPCAILSRKWVERRPRAGTLGAARRGRAGRRR